MAYTPGVPPAITDYITLYTYLEAELKSIAAALREPDVVTFPVLHAEPPRPVAGYLAFADGTDWNPGSGRGFYEYRTSSWVKL